MPTTKSTKSTKSALFDLSLETAGKTYNTTGKTVEDALNAIKIDWQLIKAKGVVKVKKDNKSCEHLFYIHQLRKLFLNKLTRKIWGKHLELRMR